MADSMTLAHEHTINNPRESCQKVADLYEVSKPSLHDRHTGVHSSHTISAPRRLSIVQEEELVNKINGYAERSTLLTPRHAVEFAEAVYVGEMGVKLGSRSDDYKQTFQRYVKDVYDIGLKAPHLIFSMDKAAFELSSSRRMRRVAPRTNLRNDQAVQSSNEHIASVACIGIDSAPIPPFIIYQIHHLSRLTTARKLVQAFDPYTRDIATGGRDRRLLIRHERCRGPLPAKMSGRFQPLDVDFFNALKAAYHRQLDEYQLGSSLREVVKGIFWGWRHRAWGETATSRQIRGAWRESGLFPLDPAVREIEEQAPATPPLLASTEDPLIPRNLRILRANNHAVRQGKVAPLAAMIKLEKANEQLMARNAILEKELARVKLPRGLTKLLGGEEHAEELAVRKAEKEDARRKRRRTARARRNEMESNAAHACTPGSSGTS
ncbi:hypothetical protein LQV05_000350 [Cryptococcus neoformans]|nr:hypothetical protein LQV05_000350 [Cryptococcus neoformans]